MSTATTDAYCASEVIIEWGDNCMELAFGEPVLTMAEITEAVQQRFPGIRPVGQWLQKGVCRVVFNEKDFPDKGHHIEPQEERNGQAREKKDC